MRDFPAEREWRSSTCRRGGEIEAGRSYDPAARAADILGTLEKAGEVLSLFSAEQSEWGVSEAAKHLGVPKSSLHAVFAALAGIELLERRPNGRYGLGWRFVEQSRTLLSTTDYRPHALRAMRQVISRHGETMHLATWSRGRVVYIDTLRPAHGVPSGTRAQAAHTSALGKVLMSARADDELDDALGSRQLPSLTEHTLTSTSALREDLWLARSRGFAYDQEEGRCGLCCVAAPMRAPDGTVTAAISICAPRPRFDRMRQEYTRAVLMAAGDASSRLLSSSEPAAGR